MTRDIFGEDFRFIGLAFDDDGKARAVTTQPFLRGDAPTYDEITRFLGEFGFREVERGNFFRKEDDTAVVDPWERNFAKIGDQLLPFDIIPLHARGPLRKYERRNCPA